MDDSLWCCCFLSPFCKKILFYGNCLICQMFGLWGFSMSRKQQISKLLSRHCALHGMKPESKREECLSFLKQEVPIFTSESLTINHNSEKSRWEGKVQFILFSWLWEIGWVGGAVKAKQAKPHMKLCALFNRWCKSPAGRAPTCRQSCSGAPAIACWPKGEDPLPKRWERKSVESNREPNYATRVPGHSYTGDAVATWWLPKPPDHHKGPGEFNF